MTSVVWSPQAVGDVARIAGCTDAWPQRPAMSPGRQAALHAAAKRAHRALGRAGTMSTS
jgi:hypothetical protein